MQNEPKVKKVYLLYSKLSTIDEITTTDRNLIKRYFFKWKNAIDLLYYKILTYSKSISIKGLIDTKYHKIKHHYFKRFFLNTTSKIILNVNQINTAQIDLNIIRNQAVVLQALDLEERTVDNKIGVLKDFLFEQNIFNLNNEIDQIETYDVHKSTKRQNTSNNQAKINNIIQKFTIIRSFNQLRTFFRIWKNKNWKFESFSSIIDAYNDIKAKSNITTIKYLDVKADFKKSYLESKQLKDKSCIKCISHTIDLNSNILDDLSIDLEEESNQNNENNENLSEMSNTKKLLLTKTINIDYEAHKESIKEKNEVFKQSNMSNISNLNNLPLRSRIEVLEKRIKNLNNKFEKEKSAYETLLTSKYELLNALNHLKQNKYKK